MNLGWWINPEVIFHNEKINVFVPTHLHEVAVFIETSPLQKLLPYGSPLSVSPSSLSQVAVGV